MRNNTAKTETAKEKKVMELLTAIAKEHLNRETLDSRHSDSLDFFDCGVLSLRDALLAAYKAGGRRSL